MPTGIRVRVLLGMGNANREGYAFGARRRCFRSRSVVVLSMKNAALSGCCTDR